MLPSGWYLKALARVTMAPVSVCRTTSPVVFPAGLGFCPATTTAMKLRLPMTISVALAPASTTRTMREPPASRAEPVMVTSLPVMPMEGEMSVIRGGPTYVKPSARVAKVPFSLKTETAPVPAPAKEPARTTT